VCMAGVAGAAGAAGEAGEAGEAGAAGKVDAAGAAMRARRRARWRYSKRDRALEISRNRNGDTVSFGQFPSGRCVN